MTLYRRIARAAVIVAGLAASASDAGLSETCTSGTCSAHADSEMSNEKLERALAAAMRERAALLELVTNPRALAGGLKSNIAATELEMTLGSGDIAVRKSRVHSKGRGGFARRNFASGELLSVLKCSVVPSDEERDERHSWPVNATHSCDGSEFPLYNPALYFQSIAGLETCSLRNAKVEARKNGEIAFVATKSIKKDEELLVDFGPKYFKLQAPGAYECHMSALGVASSRGDAETVEGLLGDAAKKGWGAAIHRWLPRWLSLAQGDGQDPADADSNLTARGLERPDAVLGWTPLMEASNGGHVDVVDVLLRAGADANAHSRDGQTSLWLAARQGHAEVARQLLAAGADASDVDALGVSPLFAAARDGHRETVRMVRSHGVDVDQASQAGFAPLFFAAQEGHTAMVRVLIAARADVEKTNAEKVTPIYMAAQEGHGDVVMALRDGGADIEKPLEDGATPLIIAAENGHAYVLTALLSFGVELDAAKRSGATAMCMAAQKGHGHAVKALLTARADKDKAAGNGVTPLFLASMRDHVDIVRMLLAARASVDARAKDGATALAIAAKMGHSAVQEALREGGAGS